MIPASHCSLKCVSRSSSPGQVFIPIANWKPRDPPVFGDDIGPQIVHVYEVQTHMHEHAGETGDSVFFISLI